MGKKLEEKEDRVFQEAEALGREIQLFKYDREAKDSADALKVYHRALTQDSPERPLTDWFVSLF